MAKEASLGAEFQYTISAVLTTVAQVTSISGPDIEVDTIDVTSHDSTGGWEEHVAGIKRSGTLTLELVYDTANAQIVKILSELRTAVAMKILFNNAASDEMAFTGLVTGFSQAAPVDGAFTASLTVKPTGAVTFPS